MKCTDVNEQIVDYLYEEMAPDERRAFEAHVASCAACRTEVNDMAATLGLARATLAANDEPVPAQVHATAAALVGVAVRTGTGSLRPVGAPVIPENAGGVWSWLRKPWFFPAFAAAGVISLFFLARETLLPTADLVGGPFAPDVRKKGVPAESVEEAVPGPAVPAPAVPAPEPAAAAPAEGLQPPSAANRFVADDGSAGEADLVGARRTKAAKMKAASAPPPPASLGKAVNAPQGAMRAPTSVPVAAPYARAREQRRDLRGGFPEATAEATAAKEMALPEAQGEATAEESDEEAVEAIAVGTGRNESPARGDVPAAAKGGVGGSVARPAAAPVARARASPADVTNQAALIDLGNRLYAEGRMADAAAVYRDLIKRFPGHPDTSIWKSRLDQATALVNETKKQPTKGAATGTATGAATTTAAPAKAGPPAKPAAAKPVAQ
jgi:hypothetical protein